MEQNNSATFVWEIENFKNKTFSENSTNTGTRFIKIKNHVFYLTIYYTFKGDWSNNQTSIILANNSSTTVNVLYKILLIDKYGKECFVSECATSFISSKDTHAIKNGFYIIDRNCILDEENRLLPGGKLTIKCELTLLSEIENEIGIVSKLSIKEKTLENFKSLLENDKYSDVVCVVGMKEFKLHKNIIAAQSPVFKAMFDNDLEESKQNRVDISDIQVEVFEELIRFIYTANYDSIDQYALELFVAADMYQLDTLKNICAQSLGSKLTIDSVVSTLLLADMHNSTELKSKCLSFVTKNCKKVTETEEWKEMEKNPKNFELIKELYRDIVNSK